MLKPGKVVAGVDVGKVALVAALPEGPAQQFANTPAGHDQLLAWLERQQVDLVVGEPSGGYEQPLARRLHSTQRALCLVPPGRVRAYARVLGQAAKTDPLDARLLARYGEQLNPQPTPPPEATRAALKELLTRRQQLVADRTRERNRRETEKSPQVAASLNRHLDWLDQEIAQLDRQYRELLQSSQDLAQQAQLYRSVRGIGDQTAAILVAWLPELGHWNAKALTALAGLAPWPKDSGKQQGYRAIRGGRAVVRRALYLATLTALRSDSDLSRFYRRLRERGKPGKVAMVATMRKLLLHRNAIARRGAPWMPQFTPISR